MKPLAPNTLLQNRYLIVHLIGKGGMGEVYLAVDQRLGSAIALKRTLHGDDPALGEAFEREARTLARLRHPALPKVSDHFLENGNQFLVMEHISGDDLAKRLTATGKPFPLSWVLFWADQLLDALAYLHSHEPPIIHRDIKPQNLKLTDDNNIVLLDFGLSKNSTGQTNLTSGSGSTGSVVGYTPHYAPMEQIRGTGTNPRSDIYSLSATLYQLMTNVVPPDALSRADFLLSGKNDPIVPVNEINPEILKSISDVVLKGMSISQDQRYADAREMQRILRETYALMQSRTGEKTIAFTATEEPATVETSGFSNDKTEQFSAPSATAEKSAVQEAMGAQTIPYGMMENAPVETPPTASQFSDKTDQIQNFDATVRMDEKPPVVAAAPPFSGDKTEVLPPDSLPKQANIKTAVIGDDFGAAEYFRQNETAPPTKSETADYGVKTEEPGAPASITGDKTVPFFEYKEQAAEVDLAATQPVSAFDSTPQVENFAPTAETNFQTEDFAPSKEQWTPPPTPVYDSQPKPTPVYDSQPKPTRVQPVAQPVQEKKSSKGLLFGILGALFGLVILAAAGGGIAWYLMYYQGSAEVTPTPTPVATATPTPEATPEQVISNTDNTNSDVVTTGSPDNSTVTPTPSPDATKPVVTQQTPVPTKTVTTRPTQVTTSSPKPATPKTVTPKPQPTSKIRGTIIPQ